MDKQGAHNCHFHLGEDLIIINCTTEIGIDPVNKKLFLLNLPVRIGEIKFTFLPGIKI